MKLANLLTHPIQYQSPLVRYLREYGVDVHVVYGPMAADWGTSDPELCRHEPWDLPLLEGYPHETIESPFMFGIAGFLALRPRIREVLQRLRPDAVWIHGWGDVYSVAAWNVAWQLGIPVLLRGESHLKCLKGGFIRRWLHRQILSRCFGTVARFLAIGSANRMFYLSYGVPAEKVVAVPYAVDNDRFSRTDEAIAREVTEWRSRLGIGEAETVIGFVGKLKKAKRPDLALEGVAKAAAVLPPGKKPWLLFVGDGPLRRPIEKLARRLYPERTCFLGFQNQSRLPALYRLIDLLLLPSDFEPWGLVVNEAMCAGRAVVVTDRVGAAPDLVADSEAGAVFKSGSVPELRKALLPFLMDSHRLREAGIAAGERIKRWSFQEDVEGMKAALQDLPGRRSLTYPSPGHRRGVVAAYLGVHQVFQMAAAAAETGRLEHFYCSLIRQPNRWGGLLSRWFRIPSAFPIGAEVLSPGRVTEIPVPLLIQRTIEHGIAGRHVNPYYTNQWFASRVARQLLNHAGAGIVVGAETCALELFVAARKQGMRCLLDCHGIPTQFLQDGVNRAANELGLKAPRMLDSPAMTERKLLERELADVLVLCSELQREVYLAQGVPSGKLRVVPLWVDAEFWHPPGSRDDFGDSSPMRVLYAGAGSLAKGLPYLLAALDQMGGAGVALTLVGPVQPDMKPFLEKVRSPVNRLSYCPRNELRKLYWNHDVLVMPSLGDSFGFVAVEAMACGLPVVVTDRCGAPVPSPEWRVPAFSTAAIVSRLEHYRGNPMHCHRDGQLASPFAQQFTSQRYRQSIREIYDALEPLPAALDS